MNIYSSGRYEWLISPSINLGDGSINYLLEFDVAFTEYNQSIKANVGSDDSLVVVISTDNGITWSKNNILMVFDEFNNPLPTGEHVYIDLSNYTDEIKIGFYATSTISNEDIDVYIDNFKIDEKPDCIIPTGLFEDNITSNSAELSWIENGTATEWEIEYGINGFVQGSGNIETTNTNENYFLNGLLSGTSYSYYVRSNCDSDKNSDWVGPLTFTTLCIAEEGENKIMSCGPITWIDGIVYTENNNTASYTIPNGASNGCDSIVLLDLIINQPSTKVDVIESCGPTTWIDGLEYTENNNTASYTIPNGATNGCDSIVLLDLTINQPSIKTDVVESCTPITWIDGIEYSENNNTASYTIPNGATNGCDSIILLDLTINQPSIKIDVVESCTPITWIDGIEYSENNNTASYTIPNGATNGCDSIIVLDLTIYSFDLSLTTTSNQIIGADNGLAEYQWYECENDSYKLMYGANERVLIYNKEGSFSLKISNETCSEYTDCIEVQTLSTIEQSIFDNVTIFPNPFKQLIKIELNDLDNVSIRLYSAEGKLIQNEMVKKQQTYTLNTNKLAKGIYFVELEKNKLIKRYKLIKNE